jgi:hypothetical protein
MVEQVKAVQRLHTMVILVLGLRVQVQKDLLRVVRIKDFEVLFLHVHGELVLDLFLLKF